MPTLSLTPVTPGTLTVLSVSGSDRVVDVQDWGVAADGVTDDTARIVAAWNAFVAGSAREFVMRPGTYKITPGPNTAALLKAQDKRGIRIVAHGATITDPTTYTTGTVKRLFQFDGCHDVDINVGLVQSDSNFSPANFPAGNTGLVPFQFSASTGSGCSRITFNAEINNCLTGFQAVKLGADPDTYKARDLRVRIKGYRTYYPFSCQFSGDNAEVDLDVTECSRPYFVYGIKHHTARVRIKEQKLSCIIGGGTNGALDAPYCGCEDINLWIYNRESASTPWGATGGNLVELCWRWDTGNTGAVTHRNIHIWMDAKPLVDTHAGINAGVMFLKQLIDGTVDTTARGHTLENFRLYGVADFSGTGIRPINNFSNGLVSGDNIINAVVEARIVPGTSAEPIYPPNMIVRASGTGSPEGVLTANVGSTYNRTDGGASTSWYVKESGTGNTGWVAK